MTRTRATLAAAVACAGFLLAVLPARAGDVQVAVNGVSDDRGHVRLSLCTQETWLKHDCPYSASAPAQAPTTTVTVADVAPGQYAVEAFHDETDSGKVHQDFLGIPKEAVGFSNNPSVGLHGPSFKAAAFDVEQGVAKVSLTLRHILGGR